jgi:hypothetical protein
MTKRLLFGMAAGLLALSLGAIDARAGQITLPSALPPLEVAGNFAIVGGLKFSNFTYLATPLGSPPPDSAVTVSAFTSIPAEQGITFNAAFTAGAGQTVDYAITYQVTLTNPNADFTDAYLSLGGVVLNGGTGSVSIGETIKNSNGNVISSSGFSVNQPGGPGSSTTGLLGQPTTIFVEKDITVFGGSNGATFSFVDQGFSVETSRSPPMVPEPASLALLGIGLSGLFSIRRFLKRAVA